MTAAAPHDAYDRAPIELPHRTRIEILIAVLLGILLAALDQTIVGVALPQSSPSCRATTSTSGPSPRTC